MPPAVAPAPQMRRPRAAVGRQRRRHLGDAQAVGCVAFTTISLANSMPGRLQVEAQDRVALEAAQAAMEIPARAVEEQAADRAQHRIAQIAMQRRHGARLDAAQEPIAHDELIAVAQLLDEPDRGG